MAWWFEWKVDQLADHGLDPPHKTNTPDHKCRPSILLHSSFNKIYIIYLCAYFMQIFLYWIIGLGFPLLQCCVAIFLFRFSTTSPCTSQSWPSKLLNPANKAVRKSWRVKWRSLDSWSCIRSLANRGTRKQIANVWRFLRQKIYSCNLILKTH